MTCTGGGSMCVCACVPEEGVSDTPSAESMTHSKLERLLEVILVIPLPSGRTEFDLTTSRLGGRGCIAEGRTSVYGKEWGRVSYDLFEKISSEGHSLAFPSCPFLGFPIPESASVSREQLFAG